MGIEQTQTSAARPSCAKCGQEITPPLPYNLIDGVPYHMHCVAPLESPAQHFVDFVLRHTWPERAKAHGFETVHSLIAHHPFAKAHGSKHAVQPEGK